MMSSHQRAAGTAKWIAHGCGTGFPSRTSRYEQAFAAQAPKGLFDPADGRAQVPGQFCRVRGPRRHGDRLVETQLDGRLEFQGLDLLRDSSPSSQAVKYDSPNTGSPKQ